MQVDGEGTVLLTDTVRLGSGRDPHRTLWPQVWNRSQNADDAARDRQVAIEGAWHRDLVALLAEGGEGGVPDRRPGPVRRPAAGPAGRVLHPCGDRTARDGPGMILGHVRDSLNDSLLADA